MGPDGISVQMLLSCDQSVVLPLKNVHNTWETSVYPDTWKIANVTLVETFVYRDTWKVANVTPIETSVYPDTWKVANVTPVETFVYRDMWKVANVTQIYKKENMMLVNIYRPISLLPICGKIFEKSIFNHLYSYLNSNNLFTENQSGFRPGDSKFTNYSSL